MGGASPKSRRASSRATGASTSSLASAGGPTRSSSRAGPTTDPSGPDHVPASRSAARDALAAFSTRGTFGPLFNASSPSADLQSSLGEQVASRDGYEWLAGVRADLEGDGYALGAVDLPAACVGAPHIRQRLFWVAESRRERDERDCGPREARGASPAADGEARERQRGGLDARGGCADDGLADAEHERARSRAAGEQGESRIGRGGPADGGGVGDPTSFGRSGDEWRSRPGEQPEPSCDGRVDDAAGPRHQQTGRRQPGQPEGRQRLSRVGRGIGFWDDFGIVWCDERAFGRGWVARRVEPGSFPLAHGVPARVVRLRGYGNAINPEVAAIFVRGYLDVRG